MGEQPPPLVSSPASRGRRSFRGCEARVTFCGRCLWQAFQTDLGQEEWENRGSQRREDISREMDPDRPKRGQDRPSSLPRYPGRHPRDAKIDENSFKIGACSQDSSRKALGRPKVDRATNFGLPFGRQNGAQIVKNAVKIRCHF